MADITLSPVTSSNIAALGYDGASQTLAVQFRNGDTWHYEGVPQEAYDSLRGAESVGRAFNAEIRGSYEGAKQ